MNNPFDSIMTPHLALFDDCGAPPRSGRGRWRAGVVAVVFAVLSTGPLLTAQTTSTFTGDASNLWRDAIAWSNGVPGVSTDARITDNRSETRSILLPPPDHDAAVAKSLTVSIADGGGDQYVRLVGGTLNLTPAAAELLRVGVASAFVDETRLTRLTLDGTTLNSTGLASIGKGVPAGAGGVLRAVMELGNGAMWFHPGQIEVGGGDGIGELSIREGSVLAGGIFPGVGQDPRLFINANSSLRILGNGRFSEINVNSVKDSYTGASSLGVYGGLETNRLLLGETAQGRAIFAGLSPSWLGDVSIARASEMVVSSAANAKSVNLDDGHVSVWGSLVVGDPRAPVGVTNLLQMAAQAGSSASLTLELDGNVTVHSSALLGGYGDATVDFVSRGVLDIRGTALLGQGESIPGGAAGSGTVNVTGAGSVFTAQNLVVGYNEGAYRGAPSPTGSITIGDGGRVEVTGSTLEYDIVLPLGGGLAHVINHTAGTMTIGAGGTLDFLDNTGKVAFIDPSRGGTLSGTQQLINHGTIMGGDGTAPGLESGGQVDFGTRGGTLVNLGTINPGHSPGWLTINGNLTFSDLMSPDTGRLLIELGGTRAGLDYDVLDIWGNANFTGGTLELSLINGYVPQLGDYFDFLRVGGAYTGWFSSIINDTGLDFDFSSTQGDNGWFRFTASSPTGGGGSIPDGGMTVILLGSCFAGLALLRRRIGD